MYMGRILKQCNILPTRSQVDLQWDYGNYSVESTSCVQFSYFTNGMLYTFTCQLHFRWVKRHHRMTSPVLLLPRGCTYSIHVAVRWACLQSSAIRESITRWMQALWTKREQTADIYHRRENGVITSCWVFSEVTVVVEASGEVVVVPSGWATCLAGYGTNCHAMTCQYNSSALSFLLLFVAPCFWISPINSLHVWADS